MDRSMKIFASIATLMVIAMFCVIGAVLSDGHNAPASAAVAPRATVTVTTTATPKPAPTVTKTVTQTAKSNADLTKLPPHCQLALDLAAAQAVQFSVIEANFGPVTSLYDDAISAIHSGDQPLINASIAKFKTMELAISKAETTLNQNQPSLDSANTLCKEGK